jgi:hypothetical protein
MAEPDDDVAAHHARRLRLDPSRIYYSLDAPLRRARPEAGSRRALIADFRGPENN